MSISRRIARIHTADRQVTKAPAPTVTRRPEDDRYTDLGSATVPGDDYFIVIDGRDIGGTYWANDHTVQPGFNWMSWGPAGLRDGFRTREEAEQVQVAAYTPAPKKN
ncbi:hypothetical protein PV405_35650, partial [Streptomyces sp. ME02-6979-3A]|nr:hypothetical protein [Streptomyces sp. ME02-6979-3A]